MSKIADTDPAASKRHRLYNAFGADQNLRQHRRNILEFIRQAMKPARLARERHRFEPMRANLNRALAFAGLEVSEAGELTAAEQASTLREAERRAQELRAVLSTHGVHTDVLRFCRAELLEDNYFHAVLEAVKSMADKIRSRTGLADDGDELVTARSYSYNAASKAPLVGIHRAGLLSLLSLIHRRMDKAHMPPRV